MDSVGRGVISTGAIDIHSTGCVGVCVICFGVVVNTGSGGGIVVGGKVVNFTTIIGGVVVLILGSVTCTTGVVSITGFGDVLFVTGFNVVLLRVGMLLKVELCKCILGVNVVTCGFNVVVVFCVTFGGGFVVLIFLKGGFGFTVVVVVGLFGGGGLVVFGLRFAASTRLESGTGGGEVLCIFCTSMEIISSLESNVFKICVTPHIS